MSRTIAFLSLILVTFGLIAMSKPVTAAAPDKYADLDFTVSLQDVSGHCVATIDWTELKGGKTISIRVRLTYNHPTFGYITSLVPNADRWHDVRQNAGQLVVDFDPAAAVDGTTDHRVAVTFGDRWGLPLSPTLDTKFAQSACG